MVEKSGSAASGAGIAGFPEALEGALHVARSAFAVGEVGDAERAAKAISALAKAARDVMDLAAFMRDAAPSEENVEALRAELRRRLSLFVEADLSGAPPEVLERIAIEGRA